MNIALRRPMSLAEFLAWEETAGTALRVRRIPTCRHVGGSAAHAAVQRNLLSALTVRLRGKRCQPYGSDLKIEAAGGIRYSDAFVVCTKVAHDANVIHDPVVIFEVLSPSIARVDRVTRNVEYRATASVQCYVMLEQDSQRQRSLRVRVNAGWFHC